VKQTLWYRLFKRPRFPAALAEAAPGALLAQEGVSVKVSASDVRAKGLRVSRSVRLTNGSIVVRDRDTVLAAIRNRMLLGPGGRPATLRFAEDGIHIVVDVAEFADGASGRVEIVFRGPVDAAVLAAMGTEERAVTLAHGASLRQWLGGGSAAVAG